MKIHQGVDANAHQDWQELAFRGHCEGDGSSDNRTSGYGGLLAEHLQTSSVFTGIIDDLISDVSNLNSNDEHKQQSASAPFYWSIDKATAISSRSQMFVLGPSGHSQEHCFKILQKCLLLKHTV